LSTRAHSAITRALRADKLITPLEMIKSTLSSGSGMASSSLSNGSTLDRPALAAASGPGEHLGQEVQCDHPTGRPVGCAAKMVSMPTPYPSIPGHLYW
jgi:hypothetical protein